MNSTLGMDSYSTQPASQFHQQLSLTGRSNICFQDVSDRSGKGNTLGEWVDIKPVLCPGSPLFLPSSEADSIQPIVRLPSFYILQNGLAHQSLCSHDLLSQLQACTPYSYSDTQIGSVLASYGSHALVNPQMVVRQPGQVPLPHVPSKDKPIYVNPKQYHAILRRRQLRAKLEARNKFPKARKPYLHESRHLHAIKRTRGSGGRFLNTKKLQEQVKLANLPDVKNPTDPCAGNVGGRVLRSEVFTTENDNFTTSSTPSSSEVTNVSDEVIAFQQQEHLDFSSDLQFHVRRLNMTT